MFKFGISGNECLPCTHALSVKHLDILYKELPELFASKELPENWGEDLIIAPVPDVERITKGESTTFKDEPGLLVEPVGTEMADDLGLSVGEQLDDLGPSSIDLSIPPPEPSPEVVRVIGGDHGGAPIPYSDRTRMPPPDYLAFYLPFHFYYPEWWGVYLIYEGVLWLAAEIIRRSNNRVERRQAFESARIFLYYHEAFHHKTEYFATRLELTHRKAFYKEGFAQFYRQTAGSVDCLEEGLANATALTETLKKARRPEVDKALAGYVADCPPGHREGNTFRRVFEKVRCEFAEKNQRICLPQLPFKDPDIWRTAPHLFHGIANIKSEVNYVLFRGSPVAERLRLKPCLPPRKVVKKLWQLVGLEMVREGGRHEVWKTAAGNIVEIPRHARDLGGGLLRKILRQADLDMGLEEFMRR